MRASGKEIGLRWYLAVGALVGLGAALAGAAAWIPYVGGALVAAVMIGVDLRRARRAAPPDVPRRPFVQTTSVAFGDREVVVSEADERRGAIAWDDVSAIRIVVMNEGFVDVPYWVLSGAAGHCAFPSDAIGAADAMDALGRRLPGFHSKASYAAVALAMGAASGAFDVWRRGGREEVSA